MDTISARQAAGLLGITIDNLSVLEKQGIIHSIPDSEGVFFYSSREITHIKSRRGLTLAEEAAQVDIGIQRELVSSVTSTRKALLVAGGVLSVYALLVAVFTILFIVNPLRTAQFLGIVKTRTNVLVTQNQDKNVLAAETSAIPERNSPIQTVLAPIGKVSLGLVKNISPNSYAQVSKVAILDPNEVLSFDTSGAIIPERPLNFPESSLLQVGSSGLVANLNSEYLQGLQPGTNAGDIAIVGETTAIAIPAISGLTDSNLSGSAGITNTNLANSSVKVDTSSPLSGGGSVSLGETLTLSCPTCTTSGGSFTASSTDTLTNKTISGSTNTLSSIANSSLSNSSLIFAGNTGSGNVSLGGTLTVLGSGINTAAYSGGSITVAGTEADTLASVTGRGSATATSLTLNGGLTTTTTTALTLDSGTTGEISLGTGANAKAITIGNTTGATALNLNTGTGNVNFTVDGTTSSGKVQIGNSGTATPDLLVLDNGTADPAGVNGGMYYNTGTGKFRCYENSAWTNCIGSSSDLQHASSYDTDGTFVNISTTAQTTLLTLTITPTTTTGDIWVRGKALLTSSNNTDQSFILAIEDDATCTGSTVVSQTISITLNNGTVAGDYELSSIVVDAGTGVKNYSLCASLSVASGDTDVSLSQLFATIIDTGADVAEIYTTNDTSMEPGDVVSIDATLQMGVKKSQVAHDQHVLGVISTRPGLVIGNVDREGVKALPVALSGRVPVKVSTESGPIMIGDYLTSSSIPGVAMKTARVGTVIGMAISPFLGEGVGQILMLVKSGYSIGNDLDTSLPTEDRKNEASNLTEPVKTGSENGATLLDQVANVVSGLFKNAVEFLGHVIFRSDVTFLGRPTFNNDTAGHAFIKAGDGEVSVTFEKEYANNPVVTASVNLVGAVKPDELPGYAIYDSNAQGFKIKLSRVTASDLYFSWIALAVSEDTVSKSVLNTPVFNPTPSVVTEEPAPPVPLDTPQTPSPFPSPTVSTTPEITPTIFLEPDVTASISASLL